MLARSSSQLPAAALRQRVIQPAASEAHSTPPHPLPDHTTEDASSDEDRSCEVGVQGGGLDPPNHGHQVSSSVDAGVVLMRVSGALVGTSVPAVWRNIQASVDQVARGSVIVVDLSLADYLDSFAVTALMNLHQRSRRQRVELRVVATPGQLVRRMLRLAGVESLLAIHDSVEEASATPPPLRRDAITVASVCCPEP